VEEFERERQKFGKKAEDFVTQCYALHEELALSLRSLKASAADRYDRAATGRCLTASNAWSLRRQQTL
jgi:hypothetical protein